MPKGMIFVRLCTLAVRGAVSIAIGAAIWSAHLRPAVAATANDCAPAGDVKFICGAPNVEDFAPVPGTHWVIGSDLAPAGRQGYLQLFDTRNDTVNPGAARRHRHPPRQGALFGLSRRT
jgi:hypothetical protein